MKRDWLLCLLGFSLALNLGTIGALVYLRHQARAPKPPVAEPPPPFREMAERLNLSPSQRELFQRFFREQRRQMLERRRELLAKRRELVTLMQAEPLPEWPALQAKVREISEVQSRLEEELAQHLLELQRHLEPHQRAAMAAFLEQRLSRFPPGPGRMWGPHRGPGPSGGLECPPGPPPRQP